MARLDAPVGIALPAMGREFAVGVDRPQWVVTAYTLTLASLLLLGGNLGDWFGAPPGVRHQGRWFGLGSALCGLGPGARTLVLTCVLQGMGGGC